MVISLQSLPNIAYDYRHQPYHHQPYHHQPRQLTSQSSTTTTATTTTTTTAAGIITKRPDSNFYQEYVYIK